MSAADYNEAVLRVHPRKKPRRSSADVFDDLIKGQIEKERTDDIEIVEEVNTSTVKDDSKIASSSGVVATTSQAEIVSNNDNNVESTLNKESQEETIEPEIENPNNSTNKHPPKRILTRKRKAITIYSGDESAAVVPNNKEKEDDDEEEESSKDPKSGKTFHNWSIHYAALLEYYKEHGTCNVPGDYQYECNLAEMGKNGEDYHYEGNLGGWLASQRASKRLVKGYTVLKPDRETLLQILVDEGKLLWKSPKATPQKATSSSSSSSSNSNNAAAESRQKRQSLKMVNVDDENDNGKKDVVWSRHFAALLEYYNQHGTCNVQSRKAIFECTLVGMGNNNDDGENNNDKMDVNDEDNADDNINIIINDGGVDDYNNNDDAEGNHDTNNTNSINNISATSTTTNINKNSSSGSSNDNNTGKDYHYKNLLGVWLHTQRVDKASGKLLPEREAQLQQLVDEGKLSWALNFGSWNTKAFPRHFAALLEYYKEYGTCNVPYKCNYKCILVGMGDNEGEDYQYKANLGQWLNDQRKAKKRGERKGKWTLTPEKEAQLQQLVDEGKLSWSGSHLCEDNWSRHYAALLEYYNEHGTCNVPGKTPYECTLVGMGDREGEDYHYKSNLGNWLSKQREAKKSTGSRGELTPQREEKLQQLVDEGKLFWGYTRNSTSAAAAATANEGKVIIDGDTEGGDGVTTTTAPRRNVVHRGVSNGGYDAERKELIWNRHYAALLEYYNRHGTCNIQSRNVLFECTLVGMGNNSNHTHHGTRNTINANNNATIVDEEDDGANDNNNDGEDYHYKHYIGTWLRSQRVAKMNGTLLPEREAQLQQLVDEGKLYWGIHFSSTAMVWPRHYAALLEYYKEYGTCNVPTKATYECTLVGLGDNEGEDYHYNGKLGQWLSDQRKSRTYTGPSENAKWKKWNLTPDREAKLQELVDEGKLSWKLTRNK